MFNYKNWKLYSPDRDPDPLPDPEPSAGRSDSKPSANPVIDENGNSITPDSLKKNMTIPDEAPANDLAKMLANMLGADPANKVEAASELIKYLDPISNRALPDYSEVEAGAALKVVDAPGPEVTILDADIGPDEADIIEPGGSRSYSYGEQFLDIVEDRTYYLIINDALKPLFSNGRSNKEYGTTYVTFDVGVTAYTFSGNRLKVFNNSAGISSGFSKSHFTLTTTSVIKKLEWIKEVSNDVTEVPIVDKG